MMDFLKGTVTPKDWLATAGILSVSAILAAAFWVFVHAGQRAEIAQIKADDAQITNDLREARKFNAEIASLREETERIEKLVGDFEERLPSRREIPTLLKEFEKMAAEVEVDVELAPLARSKDARKETIPYSIVARGNYHQVANFVNRLERFKRYLKVSDLNIAPNEDGVTEARFTLNTYRFLQENTDTLS